ncbi:MAG TPA: gephyrin-like molybdotransferase Glp [Thermoleophilaceae bacterium]|jgi:molybdopterin molybdotransferase
MKRELISVGEARRRVLAAVRPLPPEPVALADALGRVLAEDVESAEDLPPFDSSAMDGYAVAAAEAGELAIVDESRAGAPARVPVAPGEAIAISTGAAVPDGAAAVVPVERTRREGDRVRVEAVDGGANIRRAGEDVRAGATVLRAGTPIGPAEIAMLASMGRAQVSCGGVPRVAVVVTGDELVEPGEPLTPGQIRNSNGPALAALARAAGARPGAPRRAGDDHDATVAALASALGEADAVCISGGVSVGEHDHVKAALAELGADEVFWGVGLKPGKPTWFGTGAATRSGDVGPRRLTPGGGSDPGRRPLVFGLPGNPVSAMVTFQLFAHPALRAMAGADPSRAHVRARLDSPIRLSRGREQAVRCRLRAAEDGWHAEPTGDQGSHRISSMLGANALALVPAGEGELAAGELVHAEPLPAGACPTAARGYG